MTRFWLWILLSVAGLVGAFFGLWVWETARACTYFSALALFLHSLFGEEA